jgi:serine/threonine-protein kinase RsbW/stage II sporulation protein AB (anti-sigma F factor)
MTLQSGSVSVADPPATLADASHPAARRFEGLLLQRTAPTLCAVPTDTDRIAELRNGVEADGLLVYECITPATPASVGRIRRELADALASLKVATDRLDDIALVVTEAATNVVLHAYLERTTGPLYAAAALSGHTLTVTVADYGRGFFPRTDSPGLGFGMPLMTRLTDRLLVTSNASGIGTRVAATFEHATRIPTRPPAGPAAPAIARAELLCDYARALATASAALRTDSCALLAEARQTLAHLRTTPRGRTDRT